MNTLRNALFFVLLTVSMAFAQTPDQFFRMVGDPYAIDGEMLRRTVTINADQHWWQYLMDNGKGMAGGWVLGINALAANMGWGDARAADSNSGNRISPVVASIMDSWKGKLMVTINLPAAVTDQQQMSGILTNLSSIPLSLGNKDVCHPRAGKFFLNISFDSRPNAGVGTVSSDGGTYTLVVPLFAPLVTSQTDEFLKRGR